jgi:hypothetical protein
MEMYTQDTLSVSDIDNILSAAAKLAVAREAAKAAAEDLRKCLPFASDEQFSVVENATRHELDTEEGFRVGEDFVLTDEQQARLVLARKARRAELVGRKAELVGALVNDEAQRLVSFKVKVGSKKTTTSCRFEKGGASASLIAKLRAMRG